MRSSLIKLLSGKLIITDPRRAVEKLQGSPIKGFGHVISYHRRSRGTRSMKRSQSPHLSLGGRHRHF